jgi:hypothetical protein
VRSGTSTIRTSIVLPSPISGSEVGARVILSATSVDAHHKLDSFLSFADTSSLFFLVQITIHTRACQSGTGCSGLIRKGSNVNNDEIIGFICFARPAFFFNSSQLAPLNQFPP